MTDECSITRAAGEPVFDPTTGGYTHPAPTTVYTGQCGVQAYSPGNPTAADFGGREVTLTSFILKLPMDAGPPEVGDDVEITASAHDPHMPGARYTVQLVQRKSHASVRRVLMEEATG